MLLKTTTRELKAAYEAKDSFARNLLRPQRAMAFAAFSAASPMPQHNVVGVGIGEHTDKGSPTGALALKVYVEKKFEPDALTPSETLPTEHKGIPVNVIESGLFVKQRVMNPKKRHRPAPPGSSIGFEDPAQQFVMAGTFGAIVKRGNVLFILSNNHVLADENKLPIGADIFQPGLLDGGKAPKDLIAHLDQFVSLSLSGNKVDCAIAKIVKASYVTNQIIQVGAPKGSAPASIGMKVEKFGRTTSHTLGAITSIATDVQVGYEMGTLTFTDQIIIQGDAGAFSAAGDSGSLIVDQTTKKAVGLLFAGSASFTIANHIEDVLTALNVRLA